MMSGGQMLILTELWLIDDAVCLFSCSERAPQNQNDLPPPQTPHHPEILKRRPMLKPIVANWPLIWALSWLEPWQAGGPSLFGPFSLLAPCSHSEELIRAHGLCSALRAGQLSTLNSQLGTLNLANQVGRINRHRQTWQWFHLLSWLPLSILLPGKLSRQGINLGKGCILNEIGNLPLPLRDLW